MGKALPIFWPRTTLSECSDLSLLYEAMMSVLILRFEAFRFKSYPRPDFGELGSKAGLRFSSPRYYTSPP